MSTTKSKIPSFKQVKAIFTLSEVPVISYCLHKNKKCGDYWEVVTGYGPVEIHCNSGGLLLKWERSSLKSLKGKSQGVWQWERNSGLIGYRCAVCAEWNEFGGRGPRGGCKCGYQKIYHQMSTNVSGLVSLILGIKKGGGCI
jgi:hypothetical protein